MWNIPTLYNLLMQMERKRYPIITYFGHNLLAIFDR